MCDLKHVRWESVSPRTKSRVLPGNAWESVVADVRENYSVALGESRPSVSSSARPEHLGKWLVRCTVLFRGSAEDSSQRSLSRDFLVSPEKSTSVFPRDIGRKT